MITSNLITAFLRQWTADVMETEGYETLDELIVQGYCADIATIIWDYFDRDPQLIWHDCESPCHTWLEFQGKHYDLQNPEGVADWRQMDYFKESPDAIIDQA